MKKKIILFVVLALGLVAAVYFGCSDGRMSFANPVPSVERSAGDEYDSLVNHGYYYSLPDAIAECDTFLDYFRYRRCAYCDDVRAMRQEFLLMEDFFNKEFYSYETFVEEGSYTGQKFAESPYQNVRQTWDYLYREESSRRLRAALSTLTAHDFEVYLHDYALQLCQKQYSDGGLFALRFHSIELEQLTQPVRVEGKAAMQCTAVYSVHLTGALGFGLRKRTEHIKVSGRLGFTEKGKLKFEKV